MAKKNLKHLKLSPAQVDFRPKYNRKAEPLVILNDLHVSDTSEA